SAMPDPAQEIAVGGTFLERIRRRLWLSTVRVLRYPYLVLTLPLRQLRGEVISLRSAAVESLAYVGIELRRLGDLIERGESRAVPRPAGSASNGLTTDSVEIPFAFRSLAGIEPPGPVLVVGSRGRGLGVSLAALGFDVTLLDPDGEAHGRPGLEVVWDSLAAWNSAGRRFAALLYLGLSDPDAGEFERFGELIANEGVLVVARPFGVAGATGDPPDPVGPDGLVGDWKVHERLVVAGKSDEDWAPVRNGAAPDRGIALIAARRTAS
ncbi:MAG TPA: hypothetical protein VLB79_13065, partial [Solirubrobacterales bacterium]|nr:hypothetical protein [Solirubrobacterales bacterium]